jgi:hypothetical protein
MENGRRVFVSRSRIRDDLIGGKIFEDYLAKEGYVIFYPEEHNLLEQLTVYTFAKNLIFSEGSAMLSCIFMPDLEADVAVGSRRRDPLRNIRVATDWLKGYDKSILWIDAVRGQYQFGLDTFDALADIDWHEVSLQLCDHGFVDKPFQTLSDEDHLALVRSELRAYLQKISGNPKFIDKMIMLKDSYLVWGGPSHLGTL